MVKMLLVHLLQSLAISVILPTLGLQHNSSHSKNHAVSTPTLQTLENLNSSHHHRHHHGHTRATTPETTNRTCVVTATALLDAFHQQPGIQTSSKTPEPDISNATICVPLEHAPVLTLRSTIRVIVLSIIALISLVGNLAVLVSIWMSHKQMRSSIYHLIGHLALADLFVTNFCVIAEAVWTFTVQWLAGNVACKGIKFLQMFSLYFSTFLLIVIAYDRFAAVKFPMNRADNKKRVHKMVIAVWMLSALFSTPQIVIFSVVRGPFVEEFYQCVTYGFYTASWQEQLYTSASLVLMFVLPLITLLSIYICTFYTIAKKENSFTNRPKTVMDSARQKLLRKAKMKALMITVVIVLAFIVCWTPYYCMMVIFIFLDPDKQLSEELQAGIFFFGSSTAMINPLIYGAFHLRRKPVVRRNTQHNSSASSRAENTVMLVTFRKPRPPDLQVKMEGQRPIGCNGGRHASPR